MIEVVVEDEGWTAAEPWAEQLALDAAAATLRHEGRPAGAGVVILLTHDVALRALNAQFRGKDAPTNVLSFPALEPNQDHLGDIALAFGVCEREAAEQGKPLADHLQHLTAHGVLHLLGYDHEEDAEAESMEARERAILAGLGVPDPYAERGAQGDHGQHGQ
ncbi:MAG: rRNA maturation RNase YbeY [Caulobacterales bacterium]